MKLYSGWIIKRCFSRTPHGVRGLKFEGVFLRGLAALVAPRTGCVD